MPLLEAGWEFGVKHDAEGKLERRTARLVVGDYWPKRRDQTVPPVSPHESLRTLLAVAVHYKMAIFKVDTVSAYRKAQINKNVFLKPPDGVDVPRDHVLELQKTFDGLGGSSPWYLLLSAKLLELGFKRTQGDQSVFARRQYADTVYVGVYADDILVMSCSAGEAQFVFDKITWALAVTGEMTGSLFTLLGLTVHRPAPDMLYISSPRRIRMLADEFGFSCDEILSDSAAYARDSGDDYGDTDACPATPFKCGTTFQTKATAAQNRHHAKRFQSYVAALRYICDAARPDIAYAVCILAAAALDPTNEHIELVKRVVRYLILTADYRLRLDGCAPGGMSLAAFSDASHVQVDRQQTATEPSHNVYGTFVMLGQCPIAWGSWRPRVVLESAHNAMTAASAAAADRACAARRLLTEMGLFCRNPGVILFEGGPAAPQSAGPPPSLETEDGARRGAGAKVRAARPCRKRPGAAAARGPGLAILQDAAGGGPGG